MGWSKEPTGGGGGVTDHSALTGVTPNQHHSEAHDQSDHDAAEVGDIVDVAVTADAGTSLETPNADHRHAHGTGYLPDAHHAEAHQAAHADGGADEISAAMPHTYQDDAGLDFAVGRRKLQLRNVDGALAMVYVDDGAGDRARITVDHATGGILPNAHHNQAHTQTDHDRAEVGDIVAVAATADAGTSVEVPNADHRHAHGSGYAGAHSDYPTVPGFGSTPQSVDIGDTQDGGADGTVSRNDHRHANPAPSASYPVDVAATEADGTATTPARSDHRHAHGSGYSADAHHTQAHAIDGADHTGTWEFSAGGTVLDPTGARFVMIWRAPFACTVTNVRGHRKGGTGATVNARRNQTSDHLASDLSLSSADTWMDGGSVQNTAYAAGDDLEIEIASITGAVTEIVIQVDFTRP